MKRKRKISATNRHARKQPGLPPGTLVFTGERMVDTPNITLIEFNNEKIREEHAVDKKPEIEKGDHITWFDIRGIHDIELIGKIGKHFHIHPLALEDIVDTEQRPKFEEYEEGIFVTLKALEFNEEKLELRTEQISIYVGEKFALSFQEDDDDLFVAVRKRLHTGSGRIRERGSDYLAYALIDTLVDNYYLQLDKVESVIENLEEAILRDSNEGLKKRIHHLKLQTLFIRKSVAPLREAISKFSKCEHALIQESTTLFIRDLYDHTVQVTDTIETYRDLMNGLNDLYISELSFKMNNVMKILTIITTIFVPLSFLAGLYGMNFDHIPELHYHNGYFVLLGVMGLIVVGLVAFFWKKRWF